MLSTLKPSLHSIHHDYSKTFIDHPGEVAALLYPGWPISSLPIRFLIVHNVHSFYHTTLLLIFDVSQYEMFMSMYVVYL